jgi:subtilase family protein/peptidase inhibitor I9
LVKKTRELAAVIALCLIATLLTGSGAMADPAGTPPEPAILGADAPTAIPGRYIIVLKSTPSLATSGVESRANALSREHHGTVTGVYEESMTGFSVAMSEADAKQLAAEPEVDFVSQSRMWQLADTQENPQSWGLDRIDQRPLPLDTVYSHDVPTLSVPTVTAYVIDSGIRITHDEFGGRATDGWDFVNDDAVAEDCLGHGTHVAGTIGGSTVGVARKVRLVAVRVFDCLRNAPTERILKGVEWVRVHAVKPAVVNLSVETYCKMGATTVPCPAKDTADIRRALDGLLDAGLNVVVAAGNSNVNACLNPITQVPRSIVVGASTITDAKAGYSNWGTCLDLFAPGGDGAAPIVSADFASDNGLRGNQGTSMAAPHVAGAVAQILSRPGWDRKTVEEVKAQLLSEATLNVVTGLDPDSPNKLLYVPPPPIGAGPSIALARHRGGLLELFGVAQDGTLYRRTQNGVNSTSWLGRTASKDQKWSSVCAQTDNAQDIVLFGLHHSGTAWHRRQAVPDLDSWSSWQGLDKNLTSCGAALTNGGRIEAFGADSSGKTYRATQTASGGKNYSTSADMGLGQVVRAVAAEKNANNLVEAFALNRSGQIWHCWTTATSCGAGNWVQLDGSLASIAVVRNNNGNLAILGTNPAGQLFYRTAGAGTNNWDGWVRPAVPGAAGILRSVAAEQNADGRIHLVTVNTAGEVWQTVQDTRDSAIFGSWTKIDGLLRP